MVPSFPKPAQAKSYIKALEDRVAELETLLTKEGDWTVSADHWANSADRDEDSDENDEAELQPLMSAVRDLSLDVAGSYVGGASAITLGRALQTVLAGKIQLSLPHISLEGGSLRPAASFASDIRILAGAGPSDLSQISSEIAEQMVHGYLKHLTTNFPILYSYDVLELHNRRHELDDIYEESILNLIYGLGGHFLEKVCSPEYFTVTLILRS